MKKLLLIAMVCVGCNTYGQNVHSTLLGKSNKYIKHESISVPDVLPKENSKFYDVLPKKKVYYSDTAKYLTASPYYTQAKVFCSYNLDYKHIISIVTETNDPQYKEGDLIIDGDTTKAIRNMFLSIKSGNYDRYDLMLLSNAMTKLFMRKQDN